MIFIGYNTNISFPKYYTHHSRFTDSRCLPNFILKWWNNLKNKYQIWQIIEWQWRYSKPYCKQCMIEFLEDEIFLYYNGIKNPSKKDRIDIVKKLNNRFKMRSNA